MVISDTEHQVCHCVDSFLPAENQHPQGDSWIDSYRDWSSCFDLFAYLPGRESVAPFPLSRARLPWRVTRKK